MIQGSARDPADRLEIALVLLLCVITWMLSHGYLGLFHDSGLYTLQALARLTAGSLNKDVFLQWGSQDRFTLFSPLYAAAARLLGAEAAAAALTLVSQMALLGGAWLLARTLMPARLALYGLAVWVAIPGDYGTGRIFTCIEPFLTPRMAAEALVLAGLAIAFRSKIGPALALMALASLLHPIMAAAGAVALLCLKPRALVLMAVLAALAAVPPIMPESLWGRFDADWLRLVRDRSPYLFLRNWSLDDWARIAVSAATLVVGIAVLDGRARRLCVAALVAMLGGLALSFIACDELHFVLFTQLQSWRWQWLGTVTAALFLPMILSSQWRAGLGGRTTALVLTAAWLFASNGFAMTAAALALASLAGSRRLKPGEARLVFWGACALLAVAISWRLASNLQFTEAHHLDSTTPSWLRQVKSFVRDGSAPLGLLLLVSWLARRPIPSRALPVLIAGAALAVAMLLPQTWAAWTRREFAPQRIAQFTAWRERVPPGAQVFWPESPLSAWVLLDRPSYLSVLQTSGLVFSRNTAMELERRAQRWLPSCRRRLFWAGTAANEPAAFLGATARCVRSRRVRLSGDPCGPGRRAPRQSPARARLRPAH